MIETGAFTVSSMHEVKKKELRNRLSIRSFMRQFQTKVTLDTFLAWKKRKIQEKKDRLAKDEEQKKKDYKAGKQFGISGREMFSFNPDLVDDGPIEDGDAAFDMYDREDDDDDDQVIEYKELDLEQLALDAREVIFRFRRVILQHGVLTRSFDSRLTELELLLWRIA